MARRRKFKDREVLEVLHHQGIVIPCFRCGVPFTLEDFRHAGWIDKEHLHELELDGPDEPGNCRYSHGLKNPNHNCHNVATNGTKASKAGSSKNRIAKANRKIKLTIPQRRLLYKVKRGNGLEETALRVLDKSVMRALERNEFVEYEEMTGHFVITARGRQALEGHRRK